MFGVDVINHVSAYLLLQGQQDQACNSDYIVAMKSRHVMCKTFTCLSEAPIARISVVLHAAHSTPRVCLPMIGTF